MTAVTEILRQLSRVRRRQLAYALQRIVYALVAAAAAAAAIVLALALLARPWLFAAGSAGALAILSIVAGLGIRALRRAVVGRRRVAFVVDREAALHGRLTTLVEVSAREPVPALLPLLVQENVERLPAWGPARIVPRVVPVGLMSAALASVFVLVILIAFAPRLAPRVVEVVQSDRPARAVELAASDAETDRLVLAPTTEPNEGASAQPMVARGRETATSSGPSLQDRIRRRLLGSALERALAAAATGGATARPQDATAGDKASPRGVPASGQLARAPSRDRRDAPEETATGAAGEPGGGQPTPRGAEPQRAGTGGDAAPGAGTGTSPDLYGAPTARHRGGDPFELSLDAPGEGDHPAPRPPSGDTPPAAEDQRPQLAARQRVEAAVPRMPVPASYEAVVRALFAHADAAR